MSVADIKNSAIILPNGKCSKCGAMVRFEEEGWIIVKNRLLKINNQEGIVKIKCPVCREFLKFTFSC